MSPELVITLPPSLRGSDALAFAREARRRGADMLEIRTDLHAAQDVDAAALAETLPLVVSQRGAPVPPGWHEAARFLDVDVADARPDRPASAVGSARLLASHHAPAPMDPSAADRLWRDARVPESAWVKHVEPLGQPRDGWRLLDTQERLARRFGAERVTVLAMGPVALPFRCVLSARNSLDYAAASPAWVAAPGQRLLDDARRARRAGGAVPRLGILGSRISGSWSPRIHPQPFDRLDLPEDAPIAQLLEALHPHYRGFAVTSPFKHAAARAAHSELDAVNTLVRHGSGWRSANTDVDGAAAALAALGGSRIAVLGGGGASVALVLAADRLRLRVDVVRAADAPAVLSGACVWTWPPHVSPPEELRFQDARVAVIAYGRAGSSIAREIRVRGGTPLRLGPRWFVAQARAQRRLWEDAQ
jgi:3-dehydroquinate dehydratase